MVRYRFIGCKWCGQPYRCLLCKSVQRAGPRQSNIQYCEACHRITFGIFGQKYNCFGKDIMPESRDYKNGDQYAKNQSLHTGPAFVQQLD